MSGVSSQASSSSRSCNWGNGNWTKTWANGDASVSRHAHWSGINIAAMVFGFVFFWPVGLFVLFWILSGRQATELPRAARNLWASMTGRSPAMRSSSDNSVFDEYQQTQWDRISEIKDEIRSRAERFNEWRSNAQRRKDQEEFDRFMSSNPGADDREGNR